MSDKNEIILRAVRRKIKLSEDAKPSTRIEIIRCGQFHHAEYGKFLVTPEMLLSFKTNFENNVRGVDLAVDYRHASEDVAAGWFKKVEIEGESLFAEIDWTPNGEKVLADKEFRYVSADFQMDFKDNETLKSYGPTLMGAGLTNRPVVKRMEPIIELSEGKGNEMDPKDKMIADLQAQVADLKKQLEGKQAPEGDDMEMAAMKADKEKMAGDLKAAQDKIACMEQTAKFDKMLSEGKVVEAQREAFLKNDMVKFSELAQTVSQKAVGSNEEPPVEDAPPKDQAEAQDTVLKLAEEKLAKKEAKNKAQAIALVLNEKPELKSKIYG